MSSQVVIEIVGAPIACSEGIRDTWRDVAGWAANQIKARYGDVVVVRYFDLFDPDCPALPTGAQLPLVLIRGEVFSSGDKIRMPALVKHLDAMGVHSLETGERS